MVFVYLLFGLCLVELEKSFAPERLQLGVGVLELCLDVLLVLLIASLDFILLVALVPLGGAANGSHSVLEDKVEYFAKIRPKYSKCAVLLTSERSP